MSDNTPVYLLATRMRNFLAANFWVRKGVYVGLSGGRCAETSVFVTRVLNETFATTRWRSVAGNYRHSGEDLYHCWTTNDKVIVDLTADQFDTMNSPVLIVPVTDFRYRGDCTNNSRYHEARRYYDAWCEERMSHGDLIRAVDQHP